jgi:hypothetical protein
MWHQIFGELDLEPKIVFCLRNPAQVARSLQARDELDLDSGEARWFAYTLDFFRYTRNCDICLLEYEAWFEDPVGTLGKLRRFLGPSQLEGALEPDTLVSGIIDDALRHDDAPHRDAGQPLVRSLYALARRADSDAAARAQILTVAAQYVGFEQLQRALQRDFERNTALAHRVPALEEEAATLQAALAEREAELAAAGGRAEASAKQAEASTARASESARREAAALAELEKQRALVPRARVAAQFAAAEAVRVDVERLRAALAGAESEVRAHAAETEHARRDLDDLRERTAELQRAAAEIDAARQREIAADARVAELTIRLAQRAAAVEALAADADAARPEIDRQRGLIAELSGQREAAELAAAAARDEVGRWREAAADAERLAAELRATREREVAALAEGLAERTAALEASRLREDAARAEAEGQRRLADELARQPRLPAIDDGELNRLRDALAAAEREAARRTAAEDVAASRVSELTERLAERTRAAAETETGLQARMRELSANLADAARRRRWRPSWPLQSVGAAIRAGDRASRARNVTAAARHYRRALKRSPGLTAIWVQLGHALKEDGDYTGAEAAYRRSLTLDGSIADTYLQLGHLLKLQARWDEAADAYAKAVQLDPGMHAASGELAALSPRLVEAGDKACEAQNWAVAAADYRRALDGQPAEPGLWMQLAAALQRQGDGGGAEAACRRALALDGSRPATHLQLGQLLTRQGRWGEAADAYARALRLDPELEAAQREITELALRLVADGEAASDREDWATAAGHYRRALDLDRGKAATWLRLANTLQQQGDNAASEAICRHALSLDATLAEAHLQLGRLAERRAHRADAIDAYAAALRLDPALAAAGDALQALAVRAPIAAGRAPAPALVTQHDVIWLCVIDWHYRIQRPQHLCARLADMGARVFYISLVFEPPGAGGRFRVIQSPHRQVYEIRLRVVCGSVYEGLSAAEVGDLQRALDELIAVMEISAPIVVVDHPAWQPVACGVPGATVVYDCLDLATGFSTAAAATGSYEAALLAAADLVVTASQPLAEHVAHYRAGSVVIRNAADVDFFARGFTDRAASERPIIGYFGAISDWFNIEWIERAAAARPGWEFRLIGGTHGCDTARAAALPNVRFYGERPYRDLPAFLHDFDVAVIPLKMIELIRCTNPVKLYEYMAAGKAVVAGPMPEVINATDLVYVADDAFTFVERIEQALAEDRPSLRQRRLAWARQHTWEDRARRLVETIDASFPLVSVVVLTYNNWRFTEACLASLRQDSDYPHLEIIVVDNASTDETRDRLCEFERQDDRVRVVLNDANLGFAAGNNVGLRAARGEYAILLNNDTVVTRGWVRDLIRPMQLDPSIGLVGPLTNDIGNEQKLSLMYADEKEMAEVARRVVRERLRRRFRTTNLAFFCVAIGRSVLDEVGLLDEAYEVGFFEDDDYCRRVLQAGYKLVIADDVFVHHHLSASFHALGAGRDALLARNRAVFEARWGPWQPHRYRNEPGFG